MNYVLLFIRRSTSFKPDLLAFLCELCGFARKNIWFCYEVKYRLQLVLALLLWSIVVKKITAQIMTVLFLMLSVFLMGMDGTDDFGQEGLAARQRELRARIETLKSEQELLLFQKQFSTMDSKYLLLDLSRGFGQLKYRSRALLSFTFKPLPKSAVRTLPRGVQTLSRKIEGTEGRFVLVFGPDFALRSSNASTPHRGAPQLIVPLREMRSIFFALEEGSLVYIRR